MANLHLSLQRKRPGLYADEGLQHWPLILRLLIKIVRYRNKNQKEKVVQRRNYVFFREIEICELCVHTVICKIKCGNFRIFLSLRFYVKSILENLEAIFQALNFVDWMKSFQLVQKFIKIRIQSLSICESERFWDSRFAHFDFT